MSLSIKNQIILATASIVATVCGLQAWLSVSSLTELTLQNVNAEMKQSSGATSNFISAWLELRKQILLVNENAVTKGRDISSQMRQTKRVGHFSAVYTAFEDNRLVTAARNADWAKDYHHKDHDWYKQARESSELIVTSPYNNVHQNLVVTLAKSFAGSSPGVLAADVPVADIVDQVRDIKLQNDGFAVLIDGHNNIVAYKDAAMTGTSLTTLDSELTPAFIRRLGQADEPYEFHFDPDNRTKWIYVTPIQGTKWNLAIFMDKNVALQAVKQQVWLDLMTTLGLFVLVLALGSWIMTRLLKPLAELNDAVDELAQGDANLSYRLTIKRDDEIGRLSTSMNRFIAQLQTLISDLVQRTDTLNNITEDASKVSERTAQAIDQQRQQVDQAATAIHQMSISASEIASHAEMSATAAQSSSAACGQGQEIISRNMKAIDRAAREIVDASGVITELDTNIQGINQILVNIQSIADQTNLLALNAAIEAARAGSHGRGFAVVADEVRTLSQRTHTATEEVSRIINTLQNNAQRAVQAMSNSNEQAQVGVNFAQQANDCLMQITDSITHISDMANQIANAAEEQRAVSEDISQNTRRILNAADDVARQASAGNQQNRQIAVEVSGIGQQINRFQI